MPKKYYIVPLAFVLVAFVASYFAFLRDSENRSRLTAEAPAVVTGTQVRRDAYPETGMERSVDVIVSFKYEVNGTTFERNVRKSKVESLAFTPWGKAKVCYDPTDPATIESPQLFPSTQKCG